MCFSKMYKVAHLKLDLIVLWCNVRPRICKGTKYRTTLAQKKLPILNAHFSPNCFYLQRETKQKSIFNNIFDPSLLQYFTKSWEIEVSNFDFEVRQTLKIYGIPTDNMVTHSVGMSIYLRKQTGLGTSLVFKNK